MTMPTVSVVMAAYNGAALLPPTIESLLAQTLADWELVVVDDRSTDATLGVLRGYGDPRIHVIEAEQNGGVVLARNRAMQDARGRYIAALDHDDLCHPERFARQVAYLDAHRDTVVLASAAGVLSEGVTIPSAHAPVTTPRLVEWLLHIENPIVWSSVMLRGDVARRLAPFQRPELRYAEDFDLYQRMAAHGGVARLDDELLIYRAHEGGASKRFVAAMRAAASRVLAEVYLPILGSEAQSAAQLVAHHVMGQEPVADRDALYRLGATLLALQSHFLASHSCSRDDRRLIRWETARRWARVTRAGLRTGSLSLGDTLAARRDHLGFGYAGVEQLVWSRLIGGARQAGMFRRA